MSDFSDIMAVPVDDFSDIIFIPTAAVQGTILRARIRVENWDFDGDNRVLNCGAFEIDTVTFNGTPDIVSIKALSTPVSSSLRREEKTRAWEDTTLQEIAQDVANDASMRLMYEVESDIQLDRVDQEEEADMPFLQELCNQYGVSLKVANNQIILFEESVYEARGIVDRFDKSEIGGRLTSYSFSQNTSDTVSKAKSSYKDPKSGKLCEAEFEPPEPPATGQVALINLRPGDLRGDNYRNGVDTASDDPGGTHETGFKVFNDTADDFEDIRADVTPNALRQCKATARQRNRNEWTCTLRMKGHPGMVSGANIGLTGFGVYSGKYSIIEAVHNVDGNNGYTTTVRVRRALVGY